MVSHAPPPSKLPETAYGLIPTYEIMGIEV